MTAFARVEKTDRNYSVLTEIRSYNSRHLDVVLRIPNEYLSLEEKIKGLISSQVSRGRIEIMLKIRRDNDDTHDFEIDVSIAKSYYEALVQLKDMLNINSAISLEQLACASGIIKPAEIDVDVEACWQVIRDCIDAAIKDLETMRKSEGDHISQDLGRRIDYIDNAVKRIEKESSNLIRHYQERLKERISLLLNGLVDMDPGRIAQEAAFLADKSDISEEIVRAKSHIKQFRSIMDSIEPSGRKLNFLLQEFNREFNTMSSKAANENISHIIVDVKSELEKIREQVQNVE
jgi:uncharacterized protein (TIGR00255 family)